MSAFSDHHPDQKIFSGNPYNFFLDNLLPRAIEQGQEKRLETHAISQFITAVYELNNHEKTTEAIFVFQQFNFAYKKSEPLEARDIEIPAKGLEAPEPRDTSLDGLIQKAAFQFYQISQQLDGLARLKSKNNTPCQSPL